jgi:hypothetical protein
MSFSKGPDTDNNNREVKPKFLLTKFQNLHIRRTKYPRFCPQLLMHSVWISGVSGHESTPMPPARRRSGSLEWPAWGRHAAISAALTARRVAV